MYSKEWMFSTDLGVSLRVLVQQMTVVHGFNLVHACRNWSVAVTARMCCIASFVALICRLAALRHTACFYH